MPLIWTAVAFCGGIISANLLNWPVSLWWLAPVLGCLVLIGGLVRVWRGAQSFSALLPRVFAVWLLTAFCLGAVRYRARLPEVGSPARISGYTGAPGQVVLVGVVESDPIRDDRGVRFVCAAEQIRKPGQVSHREVEGDVLVQAPAGESAHFGDRVVIRGRLEIPYQDENFSYRKILARRNIYSVLSASRVGVLETGAAHPLKRRIYRWRNQALDVLDQLWPDPEAALLAGILLGVESGIPGPVRDAFRETGTTHIIAISGFNITIVAGLITSLLRKAFRPWGAALGAAAGIGLFTVLVGADPAVVRAALMGGSALFARQIGRRQHGLTAAALASLLMAVHDPLILGSISFQLSLAATLGLVLYAEGLQARLERVLSRWMPAGAVQKVSRPFSEYVLFTLAAQATTLPLLVYHFHQLSWSAVLVNPLILPLQPGVMILGGTALILGVIWLPLGRLAAAGVYPIIYLTIRIVEIFSRLPGGAVDFPGAGLAFPVIWYGVLLAISLAGDKGSRLQSALPPAGLYLVLSAGALLAWQAYFLAPDGRLHLRFLAVGTGTGILIQGPAGETMLVNGGPSTALLADQLGRQLPPFRRELDVLLVSSPLEEEIAGTVGVVGRYPPDQVFWLGGPSPSRAADRLRAALKGSGISIQPGGNGSRIVIGESLTIRVLSETVRGGSLLVEYGSFRALLPAGLNQEELAALKRSGELRGLSVYLLSDHGRTESNPAWWIAELNPRLCVLTAAADDPEGLPEPQLLDRLGGYSLLRTDLNGTISVTTDGQQMWIAVDRLD
jgi:competence protein ComEC